MGCCASELEERTQKVAEVTEDHKDPLDIVVNIVEAKGVPDCDTNGINGKEEQKADTFCQFFIAEDAEGKHIVSNKERTPYRLNTPEPKWSCHRRLHGKYNKEKRMYLVMDLYDFDTYSKPDLIGGTVVDITDIESGKTITSDIHFYGSNQKDMQKKAKKSGTLQKCTVTFQTFTGKKWPTKKTFFFIRHGESKWNEAEHQILKEGKVLGGVTTMAKGRDHPLNYIGIQQAYDLNKRWKEKNNDKPELGPTPTEEDIEKFVNADKVLSSPLTRALQTCLIGLEGHKTLTDKGVRLHRQLREVKNRIGWDALGKETGEKIPVRIASCLTEEAKARAEELKDLTPEEVKKLTSVEIDLNDTFSHWWDPDRDTKSEISERITDIMHTLRYCDEETIICTGHSLFFREICRAYIGGGHKTIPQKLGKKEKKEREVIKKQQKTKEYNGWAATEFPQALIKRKLNNGACLMANFDFSSDQPEKWEIASAKLMFGSKFKSEKKAKEDKELEEKVYEKLQSEGQIPEDKNVVSPA
mmetsp:Transcript_13465/g.26443  ORF Transcript_13465/g.26443 Transcript_13465/m.26443 type:complete len:527 (-) Transcript_13465:153-1733(-)